MTTKQEISDWFDRGRAQGAKHMLVVCDTFDHDDYPVYTQTDDECLKRYSAPGAMQRVMEVYDLTATKAEQMDARRVFRLPPGREPSCDPLDTPLPCDVKIGGATFRKGVNLGTFVTAAQRWHREAFPDGYTLTDDEKAENLAALQSFQPMPHPGRKTVADLRGQLAVAVDLLTECLGPLEVCAAIESEDGGEAIETLIAQVRKFCADAKRGDAPR